MLKGGGANELAAAFSLSPRQTVPLWQLHARG